MKLFVSFTVCCSAICACALDQPVDGPPDVPPDAGGETQQAIEPAAQQDEPQDAANDEATESLACAPENDVDAYDDATATSIAPRAEGDDDHWYTPLWPIGLVFDLFGGHHGHHGNKWDPEPDKRRDRNHCYAWCAWDARQCHKECDVRIPPYR